MSMVTPRKSSCCSSFLPSSFLLFFTDIEGKQQCLPAMPSHVAQSSPFPTSRPCPVSLLLHCQNHLSAMYNFAGLAEEMSVCPNHTMSRPVQTKLLHCVHGMEGSVE